MTCEIVFKVNADTRLSPTEKVVFTNIAGGYQTRAEIARVSGCAESSVPRAVRKLEGYGYLKREFVEGKANKYVLQGVADTGISQDTGIARPSPSADTGIPLDTWVHPSTDTPLRAVIHSPHIEHAGTRVEDNLLLSKKLDTNLQTPITGDRGLGKEPFALAAEPRRRQPRQAKALAGYTPEFEMIWLAWPKNRRMNSDKRKAFERFQGGVERFGADAIKTAAQRYLSLPDTRKEGWRYCCLVEVFMNGKLEAAVEAINEPLPREAPSSSKRSGIPRFVY